jgi:hypothetical protein
MAAMIHHGARPLVARYGSSDLMAYYADDPIADVGALGVDE